MVYMGRPFAETTEGPVVGQAGVQSNQTTSSGFGVNPYEDPETPPGHATFNPYVKKTHAEGSSAAAAGSGSADGALDRTPRAMFPKHCNDVKAYMKDRSSWR